MLTRALAPWRLLEHRGPFHSVVLALLAGLVADVASGQGELAIAVVTGWLSHLVADARSPMGQPLLWPLSDRLLHVTPRALRFRSGSWLVAAGAGVPGGQCLPGAGRYLARSADPSVGVRDELCELIQWLSDDEATEFAEQVRKRVAWRGARGPVGQRATRRDRQDPMSNVWGRHSREHGRHLLRWPHLGPAALGAAILLGWLVGIVAGPLVASVGVLVGLVLGDQLDQRTAASEP